MNSRAYALITGLFILLLSASVVGVYLWLRGGHQQTLPYVIETSGSVYGLVPQSTVYYRGIAVGKVDSINFDPQNPRKIRIRVAITADTPIMQGTYATLKLQGVTGLSQLELDNNGSSKQRLQTSNQHPAVIHMHPSLFDQLSSRGSRLVDKLDQLVKNINAITGTTNQAHIGHIMAQADTATKNLSKLIADLHESAKRLPAIADHIDHSTSNFDKVSRQLNQVAGHVNQLTRQAGILIDHLNQVAKTGQTAGQAILSQTLPQLNSTLQQIQQSAASVNRLTRSLKRDPQQLLNGPSRPHPGPGEPGYEGATP